jgi:UDP-N-acetylglucosamine--N-acetylmuramyl-(pentapeptide) pyrophosphoryl-undecaprenol N-acetylglucosamine transferase
VTAVLFAGGGTGGHLMPALAIADAMVELDPTIEPLFVGSQRGVEARVLPMRPWRYELLPLSPIHRAAWWRNFSLPLNLLQSFRGIRRLLRAFEPRLVVGTGGYAAGPVVWAAMLRGIPAVLQEQNAYPGITTRRLVRTARQIHLGFPEAARHLKPGSSTEVVHSGNPIVPPPEPRPDHAASKTALGFSADGPVVLVMGGSQGAAAINRVVGEALGAGIWPAGAQLVWQTGEASFEACSHFAKPRSIRVEAFLDPIAQVYAATDLVVARSGAMSLAELAAWGLPAVLIPLPTAAANHQLTNAQALATAGAAVLLEQANATGQKLTAVVSDLLGNPARMADMSRAAKARARPLAAREIAAKALTLLPHN